MNLTARIVSTIALIVILPVAVVGSALGVLILSLQAIVNTWRR